MKGVCSEKHGLYLQQFGVLFQNNLKKLIDLNNVTSNSDVLIEEVLFHLRFAKELNDKFVERKEILEAVVIL